MAIKLYDLARMSSATTGTGTLTLGAAVPPWLTFANAGVANNDIVYYGIKDGTTNSEVGWGTYTSSGTTLSRNVVKSTNSNALISCSGNQEVYITALASDGGDLLPGTVLPMRGFDAPINLQLNASVASSLLTISVKGNNGSDPSNTNPVLIPFRDSNGSSGAPVWVAVTSALSINTNAVGATLGTVNSVPFRLWVVCFNNGGTAVLGLWQSVTGGASPTLISPLFESNNSVSSTAISAAATSSGVFYTPNGTTVTNKAFRIIGYLDYQSGLATAGTYASGPNVVQLFGPGIKKPSDIVQTVYTTTSTAVSATTTTFVTTNLSTSISPSAAMNLILVQASGTSETSAPTSAGVQVQIFRGSTAVGSIGATDAAGTGLSSQFGSNSMLALDAPQTTSSTTYAVKVASTGTGSTASFPGSGFATPCTMVVQEIMV